MKSNLLLLGTLFFSLVYIQTSGLQAQIPTDSWRDHLPYNHGTQVAFAGNKVYCATESALFYLNKDDNSINRKNKINGMSDLGIGSIAYSDEYKTLIVGYTNGNIDLIINDSILNIPDLKDKNILTDKTINNISIFENYAYLSCGFGIVVINIEKQEVADTYVIGPNSSFMKINYVGKLNNDLFALTEFGIYRAEADNEFLSYYKNWSLDTNISNYNSEYISGTVVHDKLYAATQSKYTICAYDGTKWNEELHTQSSITILSASTEQLIITEKKGCSTFDKAMQLQFNYSRDSIRHALTDVNNTLWCAHQDDGLVKIISQEEVYSIYPEGPATINAFAMDNNVNEILVARGGYERTGANSYQPTEFYHYDNTNWNNYSKKTDTVLLKTADAVTFATTTNKGHYYVGTWSYGAIEVIDNEIITIYDESNTNNCILTKSGGISGMDFDKDGNLYMLQRNADKPFVVKTTDGEWYSFEYSQYLSNMHVTRDLINLSNNDFWAVSASGDGILVFNNNGTPETQNDDYYKALKPADSDGATIDGDISAIVQDKEGAIWLGTGDGIAVYDYPQNIWSDIDIYARKPQVVIDGYLNPLLEGTKVSSIVVDGGNRKWIGTAGGGLFLVSPDGTEQIQNLNTTNSPLFSDNILSLAFNPENGELFIGTDIGILSYMTSSSESKSSFSNIYAFPNPVREDYNGLITIRGLMYESQVKITDIAGKLVYEAQSQGGDLVWNGKDMSGQKVHTGVYLVLVSNPDGSVAEVTKILFVR